jgi:hypothetical protein
MRNVQEARDILVRDLTPEECGRLLVHSHKISPERRKALLLKRAAGHAVVAYFSNAEAIEIQEWINKETLLDADDGTYDHPKRQTTAIPEAKAPRKILTQPQQNEEIAEAEKEDVSRLRFEVEALKERVEYAEKELDDYRALQAAVGKFLGRALNLR